LAEEQRFTVLLLLLVKQFYEAKPLLDAPTLSQLLILLSGFSRTVLYVDVLLNLQSRQSSELLLLC
jgi:hypothetical protein